MAKAPACRLLRRRRSGTHKVVAPAGADVVPGDRVIAEGWMSMTFQIALADDVEPAVKIRTAGRLVRWPLEHER